MDPRFSLDNQMNKWIELREEENGRKKKKQHEENWLKSVLIGCATCLYYGCNLLKWNSLRWVWSLDARGIPRLQLLANGQMSVTNYIHKWINPLDCFCIEFVLESVSMRIAHTLYFTLLVHMFPTTTKSWKTKTKLQERNRKKKQTDTQTHKNWFDYFSSLCSHSLPFEMDR